MKSWAAMAKIARNIKEINQTLALWFIIVWQKLINDWQKLLYILTLKVFPFKFLLFLVIQNSNTNKRESNHKRKDCPNDESWKVGFHIVIPYHVCNMKSSYAFPCIPSTSFQFPLESSHIPLCNSLIDITKIVKASKKSKS